MGKLADKFGSKIIFSCGLLLFAIVYLGMGLNTNIWLFYALFFLYGLYMACTEGISRAWISNVASEEDTGSALGVYAALNSLLTLLASVIAGYLWSHYSPQSTFYTTACVTVAVLIYFVVAVKMNSDKKIHVGHEH